MHWHKHTRVVKKRLELAGDGKEVARARVPAARGVSIQRAKIG